MRRTLAALALVAAAFLVPAPATAAGGYCAGSGVNVVVDYGALGGGAVKACGHGSSAAAAIQSAGFTLGYNPQMGNGFVCTVDGKPADRHCSGTDSYWGLFTASAGGNWVYASLGANAQGVRDGQTIAFSWQSSNSKRPPSVAPAPVRSAQSPASEQTHRQKPTKAHAATKSASAVPTTAPTASAGATPTRAASPSARPSERAAASAGVPGKHRSPTATPPAETPSGTTTSDASAYSSSPRLAANEEESHGGLPWWLPVGAVVLLGVGGGAIAWRRTRATGGH